MDRSRILYIIGITVASIAFLALVFWMSIQLISILFDQNMLVLLPVLIIVFSILLGIFSAFSEFQK